MQDEIINREWDKREAFLDQVKNKLRSGWRNDDAVLNQYFQSCVASWKIYKGEKKPKDITKLNAIYKQATSGDNNELKPLNLDSNQGIKWKAWKKLSGMSREMAKRRFITFLSEIDPLLIDVMPDEKSPPGFPLNRKGIQICAKCNTMVGCTRPLLDQNKTNLRQELFENEQLHEPENFLKWIKNALETQRCIWGTHQAINKQQAKPFLDWFNKDENRGFFAYDSSTLMFLVKDLVIYHHDVAYEMMQKKNDIEASDYNTQASKVKKLKNIYEQLSGEIFSYELPCDKENIICNQRRVTDNGVNHTHTVEIDPPTASDLDSFEEAVELRKQCQKLGINPSTGIVKDISKRCEIYRERLQIHFEKLKKSLESKKRNEDYFITHKLKKLKVTEQHSTMKNKQINDACEYNSIENILFLINRGCNPDEESVRGFFYI